jgi:hypothetical protein
MASIPLSIESLTIEQHTHVDELACPTCDQPVSPELYEEIQARERDRLAIVERELAQRFARENAEALEKEKRDAAVREAAARNEAANTTRAELAPKLAEMEKAKTVAEQQANALRENQDKRLQEQREALEKAHVEAMNAEKAKSFAHNQKLEERVQQLQRQLQEKPAHELGEGAEIDLFEELRRAFPGDLITRVNKGVAGADIIHKIIMNRKECGTIIYDSKNRAIWQNRYTTKLRQNQISARADYAILSTPVFPGRTKQLHVQDDVICLNPARVIAMVTILRKEIVKSHVLRLSDEERTGKQAKLYTYITSEPVIQYCQQYESFIKNMSELEVKDAKHQEAIRKTRGELLARFEKLFMEFWREIEQILGTAESDVAE